MVNSLFSGIELEDVDGSSFATGVPHPVVNPMETDPDEEGQEVVVIAKSLKKETNDGGGDTGSFSLVSFFFGQDYGQGAANPDPFGVEQIDIADTLKPSEIVGRTCEALAEAIKALTDLARPVLPHSEEVRLDALTTALKGTALGLKAGDIDTTTAHNLIQSSFAVAFDTLGGAGMSVLFGSLGAWATTLTPSPVLKALGTAGFGVIGLTLDWYISDTGAANALAGMLTDGLFAGAKALSDTINGIIEKAYEGINVITNQYMPHHEMSEFQLQTDGTFGNFDNDTSNGVEAHVAVFHRGLGSSYLFTTNEQLNVPENWSGYTGPGPKTPRTFESSPAIAKLGLETDMPELAEINPIVLQAPSQWNHDFF